MLNSLSVHIAYLKLHWMHEEARADPSLLGRQECMRWSATISYLLLSQANWQNLPMFPKIVLLGKISSLIKKSEEPFLGRKGHRACIKTLSFKPVPVSHDADGLLLLTFCVPVLKVRFHQFPVLPVSANPLCLEWRAAAIPQTRFLSSFPPFYDFIGSGRSALSWMKSCRYSPNPF